MLQVTAVLLVPRTVAVNCCVCEPNKPTAGGFTLMETWINVTVAVACWLLFEALVAVTDTVCCVNTDGGAVYRPVEETVPSDGATVKLAGVFELNCCTWAAPSVADGGLMVWGAVDKVPYTASWF